MDNLKTYLQGLIADLGPLRAMLHGTAIVFTLLLPFAHGPSYSDDWDLFFNGILPATAPIIVIVIGLDVMMSAVWKSDAEAEELSRLNRVIRTHLVVGGVLLAAWLTVFLPVLI